MGLKSIGNLTNVNVLRETDSIWLIIVLLLNVVLSNTEILQDNSGKTNKEDNTIYSFLSSKNKGKWSLYLKLCFWNAFHITDFTKMERWIHSLEVSKNVSAKCAWLLSHAKWPRASQAGIFGGWEYPGDMCMLVCKYVGLSLRKRGGWKSALTVLCQSVCNGL